MVTLLDWSCFDHIILLLLFLKGSFDFRYILLGQSLWFNSHSKKYHAHLSISSISTRFFHLLMEMFITSSIIHFFVIQVILYCLLSSVKFSMCIYRNCFPVLRSIIQTSCMCLKIFIIGTLLKVHVCAAIVCTLFDPMQFQFFGGTL